MAAVDEALERMPCLTQCDPAVVDHLTGCITRILLVTGLKGEGGVDEIAIDIVELESAQTGLEGGFDPLWTMIGIPQLRGDKDVLPLQRSRFEGFTQRVANRLFVSIAFCAVEMSETDRQRGFGGSLGVAKVRDERAETDGGDRTRTMRKLDR